MDFLSKLDFLMGKYNLNKNSFAQAAGIPYTTVVNLYKKGYNRIKLDTLWKIAEFFNVPLDYLVKDEITDPRFDRFYNAELETEELDLVEKYRGLSPYDQKTIRLLLDRLGMRADQT